MNTLEYVLKKDSDIINLTWDFLSIKRKRIVQKKLTVIFEWDSSSFGRLICSVRECVVVVVLSSSSIKLIDWISSSICKVLFSLSWRLFVGLRDFLRDVEVVGLLFVSVGRNGAEFCRCFDDELPSINMTSSSTSRSPRWPGINSVRIISCCCD